MRDSIYETFFRCFLTQFFEKVVFFESREVKKLTFFATKEYRAMKFRLFEFFLKTEKL